MTTYTLNQENLNAISERVSTPKYNRTQLTTGIVHIGIGGFHRAHEAFYTDQLLHDTSITNWAICGVALLPHDTKIYQTLKAQDGLYTLMVKEFDGSLSKRVIGAITELLFAPEDPSKVIEKIASPEVKIVTLTITEGGYNYNEATGAFDDKNPSILYDIAHPTQPKTVFGYLTQALKLRQQKGLKGITIQSCDNIQGNGDMTKQMLLSYVKLADPALIPWIEQRVAFPNSMVDRITPATTAADIEQLKTEEGIVDAWPVVCEPFKQWVIEDQFSNGRPLWEVVGAQFVKDVEPYEKMKLSLLNAGHSVLGILGALVGYITIDEAVNDKNINAFLEHYLKQEVVPTLSDLENVDLEAYIASLLQRFGNVSIKDQIDRICSESSAKFPIFILPTVKANLKLSRQTELAAFVVAAWAIYSLGTNEKDEHLNIKDALKDTLHKQAELASQNHPEYFLEIESVFGNLKTYKPFVDAYVKAYKTITKEGVIIAVQNINLSQINSI
ncbi:mannitol dehydrogenase family protein [Winogradskyella psychrotolerans]|uniref:mannitol dehydrogenase family protein n=1 Tax=Winogradskyella psychrotolerans TaxID=1344585 RepID=UPI001C070466|nr:mannitol dehydrogenase family protein [Winogradskyella psychrotolerans]MBU2921072.1 mannitol dehydrogenase family protein [Winogradskyella psychrotolerans]